MEPLVLANSFLLHFQDYNIITVFLYLLFFLQILPYIPPHSLSISWPLLKKQLLLHIYIYTPKSNLFNPYTITLCIFSGGHMALGKTPFFFMDIFNN